MGESKYAPLQKYLANKSTGLWKATFSDVEKVLGFKLPRSAYTYPAWWGNHVHGSRHSKAWMEIDWEVRHLDIPARTVSFHKKSGAVTPSDDGVWF
jgi:hypothetical protein